MIFNQSPRLAPFSLLALVMSTVLVAGVPPVSPVEAEVAPAAAACPVGSSLIETDPAPDTCYQTFTTSGTFTPPVGVTAVDVLVVGGGGGGAQGGVVGGQVLSGGGGGGGAVNLQEVVAVSGDVTVTVGAGGAGGAVDCTVSCPSTGAAGGNGGPSSFGITTAAGGTGGSGGAAGPVAGDGGASGNSNAGGGDVVTDFGLGGATFSGGGGGGGAGGAGGAASTPIVICHVGDEDVVLPPDRWMCGGDGGKGLLPTGGDFTSAFWPWLALSEVTTYGFGPGGAGAVVGLWRDNGTSPSTYWASGRGVELDGDPLARGSVASGGDAWSLNVSPGAPPVPDRSSSVAFGWDNETYGGGGSGGTGAGAGLTTSNRGSAGTAGIVIVTFPAGEVTEVASTTTYTGTTGPISAGTPVDLSATVAPSEGVGTCDTEGLLTYFFDDGEGETELFGSLDTTWLSPGDYTITIRYAGDGTCLPSESTGTFTITAGAESTTTYTGTSGTITAGTPVILSATVAPDTCDTEGLLFYGIFDSEENLLLPEGTTFDTTDLPDGLYQILVYYEGDGTCEESVGFGSFMIGQPLTAGSTTGGGRYDVDIFEVDSQSDGSDRVHFGFTVQKTEKFDRRTSIRQHTQRGQLLWISDSGWRLKASLLANWTTSSSGTSGDTPVFGIIPCPSFVGFEGSNPQCGTIRGYGVLQYWDDEVGEFGDWVSATQFGDGGWVSFSANIGDGGSVKVCKQRRCTITDVADWFGLSIDGVDIEDGVPVGDPVQLRRQRNGGIVIRP